MTKCSICNTLECDTILYTNGEGDTRCEDCIPTDDVLVDEQDQVIERNTTAH